MHIKQQIRRLLTLEFLGNFKLAGSAWVLLMVGRGFSLPQVGLAEAVFHVVSLCCEIPSGMAADVLGRRRTLVASSAAFVLSALVMMLSRSIAGVYAAMAINAMAYNLASGTRESITYESLLEAGRERDYLRLSSWQNIIWRAAAAAALLCAGWVRPLGHVKGYGMDLVVALTAVAVASRLREPAVGVARGDVRLADLPAALKKVALESARFLRAHPRTCGMILYNALVGAVATLLRFFLQDGLDRAGASAALLGPLLLLMELGGVAGSRLALALEKLPYRGVCLLCGAGQVCALALAASGSLLLMTAGGLLAVLCDDALQMLTDARLNAGVPSAERATLISVSSMCFSLVMIVLSPVAGILSA